MSTDPQRSFRPRFTAAAMAGAYLVLNGLLAALSPFTAGWPTPATTAVVVPLMVLAMIHCVIPLARRVERQ